MSHTTCRSKDDDDDEDDNLSLADLMSLRISTPTEKNPAWNEWALHQYQQQLQASFYQIQYLQQQQMMSMMMRQSMTSSRRSSTVSSTSSRHRYPLSPSSSNSSVNYRSSSEKRPEPIKRRQSLGKRIKKVFGMTEQPDTIPNTASKVDYYSPAPSTVSTSSTIQTKSSNSTSSKKLLSFNPVIQLHETFSSTEYDRRCDTDTTCQKLTPVLALQIKEELNHFKLNDMFVHLDSRQYTHFFM